MLGSYTLGWLALVCVHLGFICQLPPMNRRDSSGPNTLFFFSPNGKNNGSEWFFFPITPDLVYPSLYIFLYIAQHYCLCGPIIHNPRTLAMEYFWVACKWQPVFHDLCITELSPFHFPLLIYLVWEEATRTDGTSITCWAGIIFFAQFE